MSENSEEKPKIIVDEDWKSQVQAEKESAKEQEPAKEEGGSGSKEPQSPGQLPPASFPMLITTFAAQAMSALGQSPDPVDGKVFIHLDLAKHMIDNLGILEEKTKGNLTAQESQMLSQVLQELRMAFVAIQKNVSQKPPSGEPEDGRIVQP